jgi:protein phosphatase
VGDSRLYRLRDSHLEQMTQDHTWISQAINAGEISAEDAKEHPWRHVLSQCLGRRDLNEGIDIAKMEVRSGDIFLLCSDGLTEEVPLDLISKSLDKSDSLDEAAKTLVEEAKKGGGSDNITVVLIETETANSSPDE